MYKRKIIATLLVSSLMAPVVTNPTVADAITTKVSRSASDSDTKYETTTKLSVKTDITLEVPFNPFADDSARSKGASNTTYTNKGSNKVTRTFEAHEISAKISGIGGGTITCPSGVQVSYSGSSAVYSCNHWNWSYSIYSDILAMYGYRETHSIDYSIKKSGNKNAAGVTLSATVKA